MTDFIIGVVLVVILGAAITYIVKAKKNGVKCVGCPSGSSCGGNCGSNCDSKQDGRSGCSCGCRSGADEKSEV